VLVCSGEPERGAGEEGGFPGGVEEDGEGGVRRPAAAVPPLEPGRAVAGDVAERCVGAVFLDEDRCHGSALALEGPDSGVRLAHGMPRRHCGPGEPAGSTAVAIGPGAWDAAGTGGGAGPCVWSGAGSRVLS
jgi:hypothetical protein